MLDPKIISGIVSGIVTIIGAIFAGLKHKQIANFFLNKRRIKLEKHKAKLENIQAERLQKNLELFAKYKGITHEELLDALKTTDDGILKITNKIQANMDHINKKTKKE